LLFKIWTNLTEVASEKYWLVRALEAEQSPKKRIFWEDLEGTLGQVIKNQYFYFRPLILRPLAVNLPSMLHFWRKLSYSCSSCKKNPHSLVYISIGAVGSVLQVLCPLHIWRGLRTVRLRQYHHPVWECTQSSYTGKILKWLKNFWNLWRTLRTGM
jgi:hypothetical protein